MVADASKVLYRNAAESCTSCSFNRAAPAIWGSEGALLVDLERWQSRNEGGLEQRTYCYLSSCS